jgi:glycosyltransferase involved in cell wall biosynthesis
MSSLFETDQCTNRPRILFIGPGESTHTHSWAELLKDEPFNVRLFMAPHGSAPPANWKVKTYITDYHCGPLDPATRRRLFGKGKAKRFVERSVGRVTGRTPKWNSFAAGWLAEIIRGWRPHIVHTFDLESAKFYHSVRQERLKGVHSKWVLQVRGGADLALSHLDPELRGQIGTVLRACDQLIGDNQQNFQIARELGVREDQISRIGTVPGTGGIDIEMLAQRWKGRTSERRVILWPRAYESIFAKALPVYEALQLCWERLLPCKLHLLAMNAESRMYYWTLPEHIRRACETHERLPRVEALNAMPHARVLLAPSLIDGVPNTMYEAMAAGAFPIVSPLQTIRPVVEDEQNVLFARNLYPEEIAAALVRAMTDDALVDAAAERNLALVRRIANREEIRARVVKFYEELAGLRVSTKS